MGRTNANHEEAEDEFDGLDSSTSSGLSSSDDESDTPEMRNSSSSSSSSDEEVAPPRSVDTEPSQELDVEDSSSATLERCDSGAALEGVEGALRAQQNDLIELLGIVLGEKNISEEDRMQVADLSDPDENEDDLYHGPRYPRFREALERVFGDILPEVLSLMRTDDDSTYRGGASFSVAAATATSSSSSTATSSSSSSKKSKGKKVTSSSSSSANDEESFSERALLEREQRLNRLVALFGDTFRDLSSARDSIEFYVPNSELRNVHEGLASLAPAKVTRLLELLSQRINDLSVLATEANAALAGDADSRRQEVAVLGVKSDLRTSLEHMQRFVEAEKNKRRASRNKPSMPFYRMFNRLKKDDVVGIIKPTMDLLIESGIMPADTPETPDLSWEDIDMGIPAAAAAATGEAPLVCTAPGFHRELGRTYPEKLQSIVAAEFIMDSDFDISFYERYFSRSDHTNFLGMDENFGPIVISIESPVKEREYVRCIVRSQNRDERYLLVANLKPKDLLKALATVHPPISTAKMYKASNSEGLTNALLGYERNEVVTQYKFGILYCKDGQTTEDEMFSNEHGSKDFEEFLDCMGQRIKLQGWPKFRGGLDVKSNMTGTESLYSILNNFEIMFHVSTMLPFYPDDPQKLERKRHLGNDVVVVIFSESEEPFNPAWIRSEFNHVFCVVQKVPSNDDITYYKIGFAAKEGTNPFYPLLKKNPIFKKSAEFASMLHLKLINAERSAMCAPGFAKKLSRTRKVLLTDCIQTHGKK